MMCAFGFDECIRISPWVSLVRFAVVFMSDVRYGNG